MLKWQLGCQFEFYHKSEIFSEVFIGESVEIIKEIDQDSAITANCIRSLCKDGKVHCVFTGKKILVDLDDLIKYFSGESENIA